MPKQAIKYDVIVVGAGPAGIFCIHSLLNQKPGIKIALVDLGSRIENRKSTSVMSGFGGAGTYSDGKLIFTAKLSHERTFHLISPKAYQQLLENIDQIFMDFGVYAEEYPRNMDVVQEFAEEAQRSDIELVVRRAKHVGTDNLKNVMKNFQDYFENNGVDFYDKTEVTDIVVDKGRFTAVETNKGLIKGETVLIAPGRLNAKWLQKLSDKHNIEYDYGMVEVGVRVEFPENIMKKHAEALYEIVFKIRTKTYDDIIRTFCSCPKGLVAKEEYEEFVCVNGHSTSEHDSENSNFAFVCEVNLTEPVDNSIEYAEAIARLATTIGGGKPVLQRLADLKKGRRSTWSRINKSLVTPSYTDVTPGDISMALPHRVVTNIIEGLEKLDTIMPGINSGSTLLYAPEVKFRSSHVKTDKGMQTTVKNVFVAGDACGMAGSITGAAATGIMAAKGILKAL